MNDRMIKSNTKPSKPLAQTHKSYSKFFITSNLLVWSDVAALHPSSGDHTNSSVAKMAVTIFQNFTHISRTKNTFPNTENYHKWRADLRTPDDDDFYGFNDWFFYRFSQFWCERRTDQPSQNLKQSPMHQPIALRASLDARTIDQIILSRSDL